MWVVERFHAYVVHAENNGNVGGQMHSVIGDHYEEIFNTISVANLMEKLLFL